MRQLRQLFSSLATARSNSHNDDLLDSYHDLNSDQTQSAGHFQESKYRNRSGPKAGAVSCDKLTEVTEETEVRALLCDLCNRDLLEV